MWKEARARELSGEGEDDVPRPREETRQPATSTYSLSSTTTTIRPSYTQRCSRCSNNTPRSPTLLAIFSNQRVQCTRERHAHFSCAFFLLLAHHASSHLCFRRFKVFDIRLLCLWRTRNRYCLHYSCLCTGSFHLQGPESPRKDSLTNSTYLLEISFCVLIADGTHRGPSRHWEAPFWKSLQKEVHMSLP